MFLQACLAKTKSCSKQPRSPSVVANVGETEVSLCLVVQSENNNYEWHQFKPTCSTPNSSNWRNGVYARLMHTISWDDLPFGFSSVSLGSKIYIVGGVVRCPGLNLIPSSSVYVFDTIDNSLKQGTGTWGGKCHSMLATLGGKLYAFGNSMPCFDIHPWAEVFDPKSNQWNGLPCPPDTHVRAQFVTVYEKKKRILVNFDEQEGHLWYFDVTSQLWGSYQVNFDKAMDEEEEEEERFRFTPRSVVVQDTLFVFSVALKKMFSYDLQGEGKDLIWVSGLEEHLNYLDPSDDSSGPAFLFHLGENKMCLVWAVDIVKCKLKWKHIPIRRHRIHCLQFRVDKGESGKLVAIPYRRDYYFTKNVNEILDCFPMNRRTQSYTGSLDTAAAAAAVPGFFPGVQSRVLTGDDNFQETRHARRVYVDGFSAMPNAQDIKSFFNTNCGGVVDSGTVGNIYIDEHKLFAIVEMSSEEKASEALKLDGRMFQEFTLKIRRPTDYNCWKDLTFLSRRKDTGGNELQSSDDEMDID